MSDPEALADEFLALHRPGDPLLMPNPWDLGSAKLLEALGFRALATTSGGFAASLGRLDGRVSREEALAHAGAVASSIAIPVSADLENCFADDPSEAAKTVGLAVDAGLAGCSIEDWSGEEIYDLDMAVARVEAAAAAAHDAGRRFVLTGRADNFLHGRRDLAETVERLQRYEQAGADVLFAPGLRDREDIETVLRAVSRPLSVLIVPGMRGVAELAELGVSRVSVGGAFAYAAYAALIEAAEGLQGGSLAYLSPAKTAVGAVHDAFSD